MVKIEVGRKETFFLVLVFSVFAIAGISIALNSGDYQAVGHTLDELNFPSCAEGEFLVKTASGWGCGSTAAIEQELGQVHQEFDNTVPPGRWQGIEYTSPFFCDFGGVITGFSTYPRDDHRDVDAAFCDNPTETRSDNWEWMPVTWNAQTTCSGTKVMKGIYTNTRDNHRDIVQLYCAGSHSGNCNWEDVEWNNDTLCPSGKVVTGVGTCYGDGHRDLCQMYCCNE